MARYVFSDVFSSTIGSFSIASDDLYFDTNYTAAQLNFVQLGNDVEVQYGDRNVLLAGITIGQLTRANFSFANGSVVEFGSSGADTLVGSTSSDYFDIRSGAADQVTASGGDDLIYASASEFAMDSLNGGDGIDTVRVTGSNPNPLILDTLSLANIEKLELDTTASLNLRLDSSNAGLTINATNLVTGIDLTVNGETLRAGFTVNSGAGNDNLRGGAGIDSFSGGDGNDQLVGNAGNDILSGMIGDDRLDGDAGSDILDGGNGFDLLNGGDGNDTLSGQDGDDTLNGGLGDDLLVGGLGADLMDGGAGNDIYRFGFGVPRSDSAPSTIDTLVSFGRGGSDPNGRDLIDLPGYNNINNLPLAFNADPINFATYDGSSQGVQLPNGLANDGFVDISWKYNSTDTRIEAWIDANDDGQFSETDLLLYIPTTANDTQTLNLSDFVDNFTVWRGTATENPITLGADSYVGNDSNNVAYALSGNDTMDGGTGNDSLYGQEDNDSLLGGDGRDDLYGGSGSDTLYGGNDGDYLYAEGGQNSDGSSAVDASGTSNFLYGDLGNDNLSGGAGDDLLNGGGDSDYLYGAAGNDTLLGGDGNDNIYGSAGNDNLQGGDGDDYLDDREGSNLLQGGAGNDTLQTGWNYPGWNYPSTNSTLDGGAGDDLLLVISDYVDSTQGGSIALTGGLGADTFRLSYQYYWYYSYNLSSTANNTVRITDFNQDSGDRLDIGNSHSYGSFSSSPLAWRGAIDNTFIGADGGAFTGALGDYVGGQDLGQGFLQLWTYTFTVNDQTTTVLYADSNRNFVVDSSDFRVEFDGIVNLNANSFVANTFTVQLGTPNDDTLAGTTGNDTIYGLAGNDQLTGLDGSDVVYAGSGNDTLEGNAGDDTLFGQEDNDSLLGGDGRDSLYGGSGSDTVYGGNDADYLYAEGGQNSDGSSAVDASGTSNFLYGDLGNDNLSGGAGDDLLNGGGDSDYLYGAAGNDTLLGGDGNDNIYGSAGNDNLQGGDGDDYLDDREGSNLLQGGAGNDTLQTGWNYPGWNYPSTNSTLDGGAGDDLLLVISDYVDSTQGGSIALTGGLGADTFRLSYQYYWYYSYNLSSTANNTVRITDFNQDSGDRLDIGNSHSYGSFSSSPLAWRGAIDNTFIGADGGAFTGALGDYVGGQDFGQGFLQLWTYTFTVNDQTTTVLYADSNRNFVVDSSDFRVEFDGIVNLNANSFVANTFTVQLGTPNDDTLAGTTGNDTIYGLAGNDQLTGLDGSDVVYAGSGNDTLEGNAGDDTLFGQEDNDSLLGGDGRDSLYGGSGSDTVYGGNDADYLYAEGGQNSDGSSAVDASGTSNFLYGDLGNDNLSGGAGDDLLNGGGDSDYLYGAAGNDTLLGGDGNDNIYGSAGNDNLQGGDGDDYLDDREGSNLLQGGAGNDTLQTGWNYPGWNYPSTNSTLDGGAGDDLLLVISDYVDSTQGGSIALTGGLGADTFRLSYQYYWYYSYNLSSTANNTVRITDFNQDSGDRLDIGNSHSYGSFSSSPLAWRGAIDNTFIGADGGAFTGALGDYVGGQDFGQGFLQLWTYTFTVNDQTTTVLYADSNRNFVVDSSDFRVEFDGIVNLNANSFVANTFTVQLGTPNDDTLAGTTGNDTIYGLAGNDQLTGLDGSDVVYAGSGNDTLEGNAGDDTLFGQEDNDSLLGGDGRDSLYGGSGSDTVYGGNDADYLYAEGGQNSDGSSAVDASGTSNFLYGDLGNDNLSGGAGDDLLNGGGDSDYLYGAAGNDTLLGGDGNDNIYGSAGNDNLQGGDGDDYLDDREGSNLLQGGAGNDSLQTGWNYPGWNYPSTNSTLDGGAGDDLLLVISDYVDSTQGGSIALTGGLGADTFRLSYQYYWYYSYNLSSTANNSVKITDFNQDSGDRLDIGNSHSYGSFSSSPLAWRGAIDNHFSSSNGGAFTGALGDYVGGQELGAGLLQLWTYTTSINGQTTTVLYADSNRNFVVDSSDFRVEFDGIVSLSANSFVANSFYTQFGSADNDSLSLTAGNTGIYGGTGNDVLTGSINNDTLVGGLGNDSLTGDTGNDTLYGQEDNDTLTGGNGNDVLNGGAGSDSLYGGYGSDSLYAEGGQNADGSPAIDDIGTVNWLYGDAGNDYLTGGSGNDLLDGGGDSDTLNAGSGNDTLIGGGNNDYLYGGAGNDTYVYRFGGGFDVISESAGSFDTLEFGTGINPSDLVLSRSGNDLVLTFADPRDQITIQNWGYSNNYQLERFTFADGTVWDSAYIQSKASGFVISGTTGNDVLTGTTGDDTFFGGLGNDIVNGNSGYDTYAFLLGNGQDSINDPSGLDTINFGAGILPTSLTFTINDADLVIGISGTTDQLTIQGWENNPANQIERIQFADGTVWEESELQSKIANLLIIGTNNNDSLSSSNNSYRGVSMFGQDGDDGLYGNFGNDLLDGGAGDDYLRGEWGNDTLIGGPGNDYLIGGYGSDTYRFALGDGQDVISNYAYGYYDPAGKIDALEFGPGIAASDIAAKRWYGDLILNIKGTTDQVTIGSYFLGNESLLNEIRFTDGTVWNLATVQNLVTQGTNDNDYMVGDSTNDTISGLTGNDTIDGSDGNDNLSGDEGNDQLAGSSGNDTLVGGTGNDHLTGGYGSDNYQFNLGDGQDVIDNYADITTDATGKIDTLVFGTGIAVADVTATRSYNNDLLLNIADGGDQVRIASYFSGSDYLLNEIRFADGTVWNATTVQQLVTQATNGNDYLVGDDTDNSFSGMAGNDTLSGQNGNDRLEGNDGWDLIYGGSGDDTLLGGNANSNTDTNGNELYGQDGNDNLIGGDFAETGDYLYGGSGNDSLLGLAGNDLLSGETGNDTLDGGAGNDDLRDDNNHGENNRLSGGDGNDDLTIYGRSYYWYSNGHVGGGNNVLDGNAGNDSLTVYSYDDDGNYYGYGNRSGDSYILRGGIGDDQLNISSTTYDDLTRGADNYVLDGGEGNDQFNIFSNVSIDSIIVTGGTGSDRYTLNPSNRNAIIVTDFSTGVGGDLIDFSQLLNNSSGYAQGNPFNASLGYFQLKQNGTNAELQWDSDGLSNGANWTTVITLQNLDLATTPLTVDNLIPGTPTDGSSTGKVLLGDEFDNNLSGDVLDDTLTGLAGNDTLSGQNGNDRLEGNDGWDLIYGGSGDDTLLGGNANSNTDTNGNELYGQDGNDNLIGGDFAETSDYLYGGSGNDNLLGLAGDDQLYGDAGNDSLDGGASNDYLSDYGNHGESNQLIGGDGNDNLYLDTRSYYWYSNGHVGGGNNVLDGNAGNDSLTVYSYDVDGNYNGYGNRTGDSYILRGGIGDDQLNISSTTYNDLTRGADHYVLDGGNGNDQFNVYNNVSIDSIIVTGGAGSDRYILNPSNRNQIIVTDFITGVGGDLIDFSQLLNNSSDYAQGNPFNASLGYFQLVQNGANTELQWDSDGLANGQNWTTVITLQNLDFGRTPLTDDNFSPQFQPIDNINVAPVFNSGSTGSVAENAATSTVIYTALASDANANDSRTYSLKADIGDFALLNIDASTGTVTLKNSANYEAKSSYSFTVVATDTAALTAEQAVVVSVTNVNEAPIFTSSNTGSVAENAATSTVIYTAQVTDVDASDTRSYSLKSGIGDVALLNINSSTGAVTLKSSANFEAKPSYGFAVVAIDAGGLIAEKAVTVNVTNVNEAPVFSSGGTSSVAENAATSTVIYTAQATDVDSGDTRTYSLKAGTGDVALLDINSTTGAVTLKNSANFEAKSSYSFTVIATDSGGLTADKAVIVSVTNVNEAPVFSSGSTGSVVENAATSTVIYTAQATDVDSGDTRTYSLKALTGDAALLNIDSSTGSVTLKNSANFETKSSYSFTVVATDVGGLTAEKSVVVSVTDIDENTAPVFSSGGTSSVAENAATSTVIYTAQATDVDSGDTRTYSLKAGTGDAALLDINATTGAVTLKNPANFEAKASYSFTVIATDAGGLTADKAVVVNVTNVNEAPVFSSGSTGNVQENAATSTVIYTAQATDVDSGDTRTYSLKSGTGDAALLNIDSSTGAVTLKNSADFETKASYSFTVVATDVGGLTAEKSVVVSVSDINENTAPVFSSGSTGSVVENAAVSTVIYTAQATDVDSGDTRTYSLKAGAGDAALLDINATTGAVTLKNSANFEAKASYSFTVVATDAGGLSAEQAVTVNVTNVNEAPVFSSGSTGSVAENAATSTVIYTAQATDVDSADTRTYSLKTGTGDAALLDINATTGAVTLKNSANFEAKASYSFTVIATDAGGLTADKAVVVNVTNVNEAPLFSSGSTGSVVENVAVSTVIYTAQATDVDSGDTRTYSLKSGSGDAALLDINATTGAVTLKNSANFEAKASYSFTVIATDAGGLTADKAVVVSVTNVNEAPVFTSGSTGSVAENAAISTVIYTAQASDVDANDTRTYSLKTGIGDVSLLDINATSGAVTLKSSANFEAKASYSFTVVATDAAGLTDEQAVVVNVTNVNEAPVFSSGSTGSVVENSALSTVIYTAQATDVDANDTRSYSLKAAVGDVALLNINSITGAVTLKDAANFENKSSYSFTVACTDKAGLSVDKAVVVNVSDVNEAPGLSVFHQAVASGTEDQTISISLDNLQTHSDATDVDDNLSGFVIAAVSSGQLKIGATVDTATAWSDSNHTVDQDHLAFWTPEENAHGVLNAFTVLAKDSDGLVSDKVIQAQVDVTAVNDTPSFTGFAASVALGQEDTLMLPISFNNMVNQGDQADIDGSVTGFVVKSVNSGELKIGSSKASATPWSASNAVIDAEHTAFWTAGANVNGTLNAFTVVAQDDEGAESAEAITASVTIQAVNDAPTFSKLAATVATGKEDSTISITLANLQKQGNEADIDGSVTAFVVKSVIDGELKIGKTAATAKPWDATSNNTVDASRSLFWAPAADDNGKLDAFTLVAKDDAGALSTKPVTAQVNVTAVNDAPVFTAPAAISYIDTAFDDEFAAVDKQLDATDADGDDLSFAITGGTDNGDGTVSKTSDYGVLTVNKDTGAYTFEPDDVGIEQLTNDISLVFSLTVSDGAVEEQTELTLEITQNGVTESNGNDTLIGTAKSNLFNALDGNDIIDGKGGADTMIGGLGNDTYVVDKIGDVVIEESKLASEIDLVKSLISYTLKANVENLTLTGTGLIDGVGNELANVLTGNKAKNTLLGNSGNDTLNGGDGNDKLDGGAGNDVLVGGKGADTFRFMTALNQAGIDTISDFTTKDDKIQLDNAVFTKLTTNGTLKSANFVKGMVAHDSNDYLIYDKTTGNLWYDADGNGADDAVKIAVLGTDLNLTNTHFTII